MTTPALRLETSQLDEIRLSADELLETPPYTNPVFLNRRSSSVALAFATHPPSEKPWHGGPGRTTVSDQQQSTTPSIIDNNITLNQLKLNRAQTKNALPMVYDFPSVHAHPPHIPAPQSADHQPPGIDCDTLTNELDEFYSYVEVPGVLEGRDTWEFDPHSNPQQPPIGSAPSAVQKSYIIHLLDRLEDKDPEIRFDAARKILYIAQGTFAHSTSTEHHVELVVTNAQLLREAGALEAIFVALKGVGGRHDWISSLPEAPDPNSSFSPTATYLDPHDRQAFLEEINGEGDDTWGEELMAWTPTTDLYAQLGGWSPGEKCQGLPSQETFTLLWKSMLVTLGGMRDVDRVKKMVRSVESLPPNQSTPASSFKVSPSTSTHSGKRSSQNTRPTFHPTYPKSISLDSPLLPHPLPFDPVPCTTQPTRPFHTTHPVISKLYPTTTSNLAHLPPLSTVSSTELKKQQFQTDQTRPFVLPFSAANAKLSSSGVPSLVPRNVNHQYGPNYILPDQYRRSTATSRFFTNANRIGRANLGDFATAEQLNDHETAQKLKQDALDTRRLQRVELLYRSILPQMQSAVIVLLKLLLATVTANTNTNNSNEAEQQKPPPTIEDIDILRHREITSKAVSAILILTLKWFKASHVMKFHYLAQLLVDSNCLLLILKMFGLQEVAVQVKTKNECEDYNFFRYCALYGSRFPTEPCPQASPLQRHPTPLVTRSTRPGEDEVEVITDYSWRNFFSAINFVHILQKLTKGRVHRILLLVQYKSSAILKRILRANQPTLQLYVLKVIKSQVPFCGRKWRQGKLFRQHESDHGYLPELPCKSSDEWLLGVDLDGEVEDSFPQEQALRSLVSFYNCKHYSAFAPHMYRRPSSLAANQPDGPANNAHATWHQADRQGGLNGAQLHNHHMQDYEVESLFYPHYSVSSNGLLERSDDAATSAWNRLGELLGDFDDISDSESIVSIGYLGGEFGSDGGVSSLDDCKDEDNQDRRAEWEHLSPETITALEEERRLPKTSTDPPPKSLDEKRAPSPKVPLYGQLYSMVAMMMRNPSKLVIVGDGACGKTCLLIVFSKGTFPEVYVPTVFENYVADVEVDGKRVELALWDTAGQEDYDRLRPLSYPDSNVILICFAIDSPDSLDNVQEKWISEVLHFCQGLPIVLVGCKMDLRTDPKTIEELRRTSQKPVTAEEGMAVAQKIGSQRYLECSAKLGQGVREVFEHATRYALLAKKGGGRRNRTKCNIL
ncbi:hypothetical protein KEM48_008201 [Puccinia striiformis f. sp. tritici PST-130]|nr:hypothetical protein KEM48_008201 [Puccinia striiformis f. sp. tritici PST-130]